MSVDFHGVSKAFGVGKRRRVILDRVDGSLSASHLTTVLAVPGGGKTTLARIVSGGLSPDRGSVRRRCRVSYPVGSTTVFSKSISGAENIAFVARMFGVPARPVADFVHAVSGLGPRFNQRFGTYDKASKGLFAFAVSYALPFDYYVVDTAMSAGSGQARALLDYTIEQRCKTSGFLVIAGDTETVEDSDAVGILNDGGIDIYADKQAAIAAFLQLKRTAAPSERREKEDKEEPEETSDDFF